MFAAIDGLREVLWLSDLRDDVESDLSVFHRIEEMETMPAPRFLRLACRLHAYSGAVAARWRLRESEQQAPEPTPEPQPVRPVMSAARFRRGAPSSVWSRATSGGEA